jgi:hypothetical protein
VLASGIACTNPFRPALRETILQGKENAHYLRFPSRFEYPALVDDDGQSRHIMFRIAASTPDILIAAGCDYLNDLKESCSSNTFFVDTAHQYAISDAPAGA